MVDTVLIEQTAKNIKLAEAIVLTALFGSIAVGLGGMYLSLALALPCSSSTGSRSSASWRFASGAGGCTGKK